MHRKLLVVFAVMSLLAGCGGGGGGTSAAKYSGVTTQAIITTSNAKALSADAFAGSQLSSATSSVAKEAAPGNGQPALVQEAAGIMKHSVATVVGASRSAAKTVAASAQASVSGYSGSYSYSISFDQASGAFSGTITFSQYREFSDSPVLNGTITFSGVYNQTTDDFTSLSITMTSLTGSSGSNSYSLSGTVTYGISGTTTTVTMSVVLTDSVSGLTYWVKDYTLTLSNGSLTITGTYYDPVHGYVVISTITTLTVSDIDATPTAGQLLFSGGNGTKARLTFTSSGATVEADTTGTDTYVVVP